ncbi:M24 family metallopeptidase [Peptacetobacter hominis]|uniref:M24 family metallopeptidase n=1 Tax=Peptacetobacter hominis TaxID=2743610 RepID=A0A544QVS8_9FIRM|nr:aminopeptidase P family N-terminal domain-containing protein [Peptacetobacter hominis]TQQ84807.1 M24 family metallopeptidase [Peptacetobacter hominis]
MNPVVKRIEELRVLMKEKNINSYVVPTADFHQSEYVGEHFKARKFITGFSGSAGTAVISENEANLWVDGRYFIQAAAQLEGSGVTMMKMGEPGVPTLEEYLEENLPENGVLGFDGRVVSMGEGSAYEAIVKEKNGSIVYEYDLIDKIWSDRPELSKKPVFELGVEYAGETVASKLERIREAMKKNHATVHILTTLDDICWTLNMRGDDIDFFPMVLSYAVITLDKVILYIDETKVSDEIKANFAKDGVELRPYNDIYEDVKSIDEKEVILIDPAKLNYSLYNNLPAGAKKVEKVNPEILFKAMKNDVEIENIKKAQIKDSVAHVRFMKWVKENYDKEVITEMSASDKLDEFRKEMGGFIRPSFEPISSYGPHAAMCHYTSSPETDVQLKGGNVFLTDTGGGYYEGSTDITRTYALGELPQNIKEGFTLVAISNLSLGAAKFLHGTTGMVLDILARKPFWDRDLNFNHGTGHGVGYLLNIHEGPTGFRWTYRAHEAHPFEDGMIITDEPGIYIEGEYGVRLENELLCRKGTLNEYGQFMYFETITFVPFDLDAIVPEIMTDAERAMLNNYHKEVFEKISPFLNDEEKEWLAHYTREI